jgi:aldehyde dehydrogenase (NAD+)
LCGGLGGGGGGGWGGRGCPPPPPPPPPAAPPPPTAGETAPLLDRTAKMYIGGKQARPDGGYSIDIVGANGESLGQVGLGNRKDIRNAVEAAHKGAAWAKATAHNRAQVLYYVAENLSVRADEFVERLRALTGVGAEDARAEFDLSIKRLYLYAAWADKWDGDVHRTPMRNITLAMREPVGVIGVVCPDEAPLLGFISTVMPPLALGNRVVAVPSEPWPLMATDLYQVFETSDVPAGAINIVTGTKEELVPVLAAHDDVEGIWYWGAAQGSGEVERLAAGNMKRSWVDYGKGRDWFGAHAGGREFLRHATEIKNIWVPYGD